MAMVRVKFGRTEFIGTETWADGAKYEGYYHEGTKHGQGKFVWADGSTYEGEFRFNAIEGIGKLI